MAVILCQPFFTPNLKNSNALLTNGKMLHSMKNCWNSIALRESQVAEQDSHSGH